MTRPYARPHISLHTYGEGDTPPAIVVTTRDIDIATVHQVEFVVAGEVVATVAFYSHIDAPLLVTQIDERPCAEASMVEQLEARA